MQSSAECSVWMSLVLVAVRHQPKAAALGDAPASQVGVVAFQAEPVGVQALKEHSQRGPDGLSDIAPALVVPVDKEADLELGWVTVNRPGVDLGHEPLGRPVKGAQEEVVLRGIAGCQVSHQRLGLLRAVDR